MDNKIKQKLNQIRPDYTSGHWEAFQERLSADLPHPSDEHIKDRLNNVEVEVPSKAWADFEAFAKNNEKLWDDRLKDKLHTHRIAGSGQWALLEEKLLAWKRVRQNFIHLRIAEAIIILLLFLTLHQNEHLWKHHFFPSTSKITLRPTPTEETFSMAAHTPTPAEGEVPLPTSIDVNSDGNFVQGRTKTKQKTVSTTYDGDRSDFSDFHPMISVKEEKALPTLHPERHDPVKDHVVQRTDIVKGGDHTSASSLRPVLTEATPLDMSKSTLSGYGQWDLPMKNRWIPPSDKRHSLPVWVSLYGIGAVNEVKQPQIDTFPGKRQNTLSYGLGAMVEFENGGWTLGTGVEYQSVRFYPERYAFDKVSATSQVVRLDYHSAKINFVSIPIQVKYHFKSSDLMAWYVFGGVRLHMSDRHKYDIAIVPFPSATTPEDYTVDEAIVRLGIQDAQFTYFTFHLGSGVHHRITSSLYGFANMGLEVFGQKSSFFPNQERINRLRSEIGIKLRI